MKTIAITMDESLIERMDQLCVIRRDDKANRSKIVREAVSEYLSRLERIAEEEKETKIFHQHRIKLAKQTAALVKEQTQR